MLLTISAILTGLAGLAWAASGLIGAQMARRHPPVGSFVEVDGGRLHYVERPGAPGQRRAVVLLHGASNHQADLMNELAPRLAGARLIAIDRPGLGWSDRIAGRAMADPARQAAVVIEALGKIGVEEAILVAHSLAGAMAARIALERPDMVKGLVMLAAVSHPWPGRTISWYYHPAAHPVIGPAFVRLLAVPVGALILRRSVAGVFEPQAAPPDYAMRAGIGLVLRPASFEANAQDVKAMYDFVERQASRYGELKMPVVAIAGEGDSVVWTHIHSRGITEAALEGKLIVLDGVGHMPHHAVPDRIAAEVRALL